MEVPPFCDDVLQSVKVLLVKTYLRLLDDGLVLVLCIPLPLFPSELVLYEYAPTIRAIPPPRELAPKELLPPDVTEDELQLINELLEIL
jgi:hypothetical protein